ncbi:DUF1559 domain-containing protein [Calycomorphotria hydatis]|uniref:Type II secretion system protein G n=1 Tax=Calycomorphotria hydatis TaxID=2528027 RepID=A0A517TBJ8_9PLAN|nr:DUF1559 domain-containing protein [Calycomorphotria hydatis]QDT65746.1 Type II secretion system protein G precursor [Calycomorphotria hydatis]
MNFKKRSGFTLIELLVVIAIIAILIALLLPAVQQAREAARRSQCKNNLKQIALALHNYHDNYNMFPQAQYQCFSPQCDHMGNHATWRGFGWMVMILPYIEQKNIYDKWNFDTDFFGGTTNNNLNKIVIKTFHCPSDLLYPDEYPGNNYVGCAGSTANLWPSLAPKAATPILVAETNGVFQRGAKTRIRDITDGTSNTILLSEILKGDNDQFSVNDSDIVAISGSPNTHFADPDFPTAAELNTNGASCDAIDPTSWGSYSRCGRTWASPYPYGSIFNASAPPNWRHRTCVHSGPNFGLCADRSGVYPPRSRHVGGVQVSLADGSVQFVSENIDLSTWQHMGSRNDGEVIESF